MGKYYKTSSGAKSRSAKNEELYHTIYDTPEYTNIEGIASIEKTNQINLTEIQELLKSVEKKQNTDTKELVSSQNEPVASEVALMDAEEKSYDIRDVLNRAKTERGENPNNYRNLNNTEYDILKRIKLDEPVEEQELKEIINTITNTSMLNKLEDRELSLNLLSSLKPGEETMIRESEDKIEITPEEIAKHSNENVEKTTKIDKSFFTSNMNFNEEDFEDLKDIKKTLKKNNILIKAFTFLLAIIIVSTIVYIAYNFYKP